MPPRVPPMLPDKVSRYKSTDFGSEDGARQIAGWIMAAWRAIGHPEVQAWVEREPISLKTRSGKTHQATWYGVRTNLVNGLPPSAFGGRYE